MSEPFIGEIRTFAGNFAPQGWLFCDGSEVSIARYSTLFALIGLTYGGNGRTTFALPDLRGRAAISQGASDHGVSYEIGSSGGQSAVALTIAEMPSHTHRPIAASPATTASPANALWATTQTAAYSDQPADTNMSLNGIDVNAGASQAHENMSPYLVMAHIIATDGVFPVRP